MIKATNNAIIPILGSIKKRAVALANDVAAWPDGNEEPIGRLIRSGIF